ncbi:MAG: hypothetical protein LBE75_05755 [Burkholderiales bacterium]|jgi:transposase|nr:hypothetical protein [Burkholderiales bacterium]
MDVMDMNATDFNKVAKMAMQGSGIKGRKWSRRTVDIARATFLGGRTATEVAKEFGVSSEYVYNVRHRFRLKAQACRLNIAASELRPDKAKPITPTKQRAQVKRFLREGFSLPEVRQIFLTSGSHISLAEIKRIAAEMKR